MYKNLFIVPKMSCFPLVTSILAGYVATDVIMGFVLYQKNPNLFNQMLGFFKSGQVLLPLVVGIIVGIVTWYVLREIQE